MLKDPYKAKELMKGIEKKLPKVDMHEQERLIEELQREMEAKERLRKDDDKAQKRKQEMLQMQEMLNQHMDQANVKVKKGSKRYLNAIVRVVMVWRRLYKDVIIAKLRER
jgi:hypothetical protein